MMYMPDCLEVGSKLRSSQQPLTPDRAMQAHVYTHAAECGLECVEPLCCALLQQATWKLITAPKESLLQTTYNVTATTFTPAELAEAIRRRLPEFTISYTPDFRDAIAKTWPASIDDSAARAQWGWQPRYGE